MINGELIVDNFAGGGGASTGIEMATGISVDIAINHDPEAIKMHKANHPNTKHYCENVWAVDPVKACEGHPVALAWFSPDCKHFSKAKGGKPKDKNIRGLAWVACRWAGLVRPRVIMLENVEEFKTWGPLNRRHHPIKSKNGQTYRKFIQQLNDLGYEVQTKELVAADYGAPTMRKRFFLIARCDGRPIVWPKPTHGPADSESVKSGILKPYVGAYTQIDFSLPCPSIFDSREEIMEKYGIRAQRPLAEKTMQRIARGLKKFVLENPEPFIIQCNHGGERKPQDIRNPMPTITGKHGFGVVEPVLTPYIMCNNENNVGASVEDGLPTITTGNRNFLMMPTLIQYHSETSGSEVRGQSVREPVMTVDASNRYGLVSAFIQKYFDGGYKGAGADIENPLPTVTSWDHNSICTAHLIQMNNHCDGKDITKPIPTITAGDGHFGEVRAFLERYDVCESNRCDKRADRSRNNTCKKRREVLEDIEQAVQWNGYNSGRPEENGSALEIGISGCSCMEGRETVSNACSQSNVGDFCRSNTGWNGYQPQEREQEGQQVGKSGSSNAEPKSYTCDKNRSENLQQLSREVFGECEGVEEHGNVIFSDREGIGNISDSGIPSGEFQAHTLIKYYGQGTGQDIKTPLDTVTAQDRFGLVTVHGVDYQIVDIGLRMLEPKELYGCQGFPDDYIIDRDFEGKVYKRSEQVRRCGNAVCPPIPAALVRANLPELCLCERTKNFRIGQEDNGQIRMIV